MGKSERKLVDIKRKNTHVHMHTPGLRMEGVGMPEPGFIPQTKHVLFSENEGGGRAASTKPYLYLCNTLGTVPMGISHALARSLNSVGEFLFSLNCSDLISICLKTGTNTLCDCKSSFT